MTRTAKIIAMLGFLALCSSTLALGDTGLLAHWKFDEGSGTTAYDSVGGNDGTLINGPVWATGQLDGALEFDGGGDYVDVGDKPSLDITGDQITVMAWFKPATTGAGNINRQIVSKWLGTDSAYHLGYSDITN
ncbi:unnamed protein product, partial [marine sediment metagenome]